MTIGEYPLVIAVGCLLLGVGKSLHPSTPLRQRLWAPPAAAGALTAAVLLAGRLERLDEQTIFPLLGLAALASFSVSRRPVYFDLAVSAMVAAGAIVGGFQWGQVQYSARTFFGVYRVTTGADARFVTLYHGTTVHGRQRTGELNPEPLTYYHRQSPIGDVFKTRTGGARSIGVVGLGVGSLAAYLLPTERWTFYEIDPAVEDIARDERFFRYLSVCGGACAVLHGDARLSLQAHPVAHDILVLDAFSSDAIPLHLLTRQAMAVYLSRLADRGILAFHISNNHLDLGPVLARLARDLDLAVRVRVDVVAADDPEGRNTSIWVVAARSMEDFGPIAEDVRWTDLTADDQPAWTDDFSNIWSVIDWGR